MIHRYLSKFLSDSGAVRNRVGPRIYFERAPQGTKGEHLIIREVGGETFHALDNEIGTTNSVIEITAYSDSPTRAREIGELIRNRISGYVGPATYLADGGTLVTGWMSVTRVRKGMDVTDPNDASDKWKFGYSADYSIFYGQSVPTHA